MRLARRRRRRGQKAPDDAPALALSHSSRTGIEFPRQSFIEKIYRRVIDTDECDP